MARICTRVGVQSPYARSKLGFGVWNIPRRSKYVSVYRNARMGRLPQGAPTSPRLSNLVMRSFDKELSQLTEKHGLKYTRYADDLCFSTSDEGFDRAKAKEIIGHAYSAMRKIGLEPNLTKTMVVPPGARKVVLGLTVNDTSPRLPAELKSRMRKHLHYLERYGPVQHARRNGFSSTLGMYRHLIGVSAFAHQIEPALGASWRARLNAITWI